MRRLIAAVAVCGLTFTSSGVAFGQQENIAEALFRSARAAMKKGDFAAACPKLAESYRLDPSRGTLLNWAMCEERRERLATAWTKYRAFLDLVRDDPERVAFVQQRISAIEKSLPYVRIVLHGTPSDATVTLDNAQLGAASLDIDIPIDQGEHQVVVSDHWGRTLTRQFQIRNGERTTLELDWTARSPRSSAGPAGSPSRARGTTSRPGARLALLPGASTQSSPGHRNEFMLHAGYVMTGVGVLGALTAGVLTGIALGEKSEVDEHCAGNFCDRDGLRVRDRTRALLRAADIALAAGVGAGVGGGILIWQGSQTRVGMHVTGSSSAAVLSGALP